MRNEEGRLVSSGVFRDLPATPWPTLGGKRGATGDSTRLGERPREGELPLFSRGPTHPPSLPFSRLARRESTACSSESSPRFGAATLPRYPCSWTAGAPPPSVLSLSISLSHWLVPHSTFWCFLVPFNSYLPWNFISSLPGCVSCGSLHPRTRVFRASLVRNAVCLLDV